MDSGAFLIQMFRCSGFCDLGSGLIFSFAFHLFAFTPMLKQTREFIYLSIEFLVEPNRFAMQLVHGPVF